MPRTARKTTPKLAVKKPAAKPVQKKTLVAKPKAKAAPAAKPVQAPAKAKAAKTKAKRSSKKEKTIRDSFNMPAADFALIGELKKRALAASRDIKKSEILRAGIKLLSSLGDEAFKAAIAAVPAIKTGRPEK